MTLHKTEGKTGKRWFLLEDIITSRLPDDGDLVSFLSHIAQANVRRA